MLVVVWMRIADRMAEQRLHRLSHRLSGLSISEGEVASACRLVAWAFEHFYRTMLRDIRDAPSRHMDETAWRIDGRSAWMWAFVEKCASFVKSVLSSAARLFLFVRMDIESTNNAAERAIRPMVAPRKVSGGSRSSFRCMSCV